MMEQDFPATVSLLQSGTFHLKGQFVYSSNYTFLVDVEDQNGIDKIQAVYKPARGERPLWDFPEDTLAHRETAAYLVSEALGWHFVPPTVFREDGLLGAGSLQLFIPHDPEHHYFNFSTDERSLLRQVVFFDMLVNNADRKAGHLLIDEQKKMWLIDHGICFHVEDKLRTVIWDYAGQRIPARLRNVTADLFMRLHEDDALLLKVKEHLSDQELGALIFRAGRLSKLRTFPLPPSDRPAYPWPPV
jgi:hypothetical protein